MTIRIATIVLVAAVVLVGARLVRSEARSTPAPVADEPFDSAFREATTTAIEHSAWLVQQHRLLVARGKEAGAAGFSLLRPGADPALLAPHRMESLRGSLFFDFWEIQRKYTDIPYTV